MAESSDDEDVPVAGLGKSHAEAAPEAAPDAATPSTKDSDDDSDDVVGGVRGRLAQKRAAAPVDDDLDDLVVSDTEDVAPGALKSRLKRTAQAKASAPQPSTMQSAPRPKEPKKQKKPKGAGKMRKRAKTESPVLAPSATSAADGDSEDEAVSGLGGAPASNQVVAPAPADAGNSDLSDSDASDAPSSANGSGDDEYRAAPSKRSKKARQSSGSDSDSDASDASEISLKGKGKAKTARAPKEKKPKPRKRSPFSESEDEADDAKGDIEALKNKFSDGPKKEIDVKKLTSQGFLVGSVGSRSTWKLPIMDHQQRINLHLLAAARPVVTTGMLNSKRKAPYIITASVKERFLRLWKEAKRWHRAYGRAPEEPAPKPVKPKSVGAGEAAAAAAASDEEATLDDLAAAAKSDDEGMPLDALVASAAKPMASKSAEFSDGAGSDSEASGDSDDAAVKRLKQRSRGAADDDPAYGAEASDEDDEARMLREVSAQHDKQKTKDKFWTREAGFLKDSDEEESDEGEGEGGEDSGNESEALEEGQKAKEVGQYEMGRMNDKEWDIYNQQMHSETQRLLRKQQVALPCRREKTLELGDVLSKIQQRCSEVSADKSQPAAESQQSQQEEEQEVLCLRCCKMINDGDEPVIDRLFSKTAGDDGGVAPLFCSNLCLMLHRQTAADAAGPPPPLREQSTVSLEGDGSDDDGLVVLPAAPKARAAESKKQLRGVMKISTGGDPNARLARLASIRQLKGTACERKREEARTSGKFEEEEELAFAGCFVSTAPQGEAGIDEQGESDGEGEEAGDESGKEQDDEDDERGESEAADDAMGGDEAEAEAEAEGRQEGEAAAQQDAGRAAPSSADDNPSKVQSETVDAQNPCADGTPGVELDAAEPLYRSAGSAPADEVAPTAAADATGPPASKESLFKNTFFGNSRPQQAKLGFPAAPGGAAADVAMSGEQSDVITAAVEATGADASGGLVDSEAQHSGEESGDEGDVIGSADEDDGEDVDGLIADDEEEEEGEEASLADFQAKQAALDDERETEAVLRGLKRKHGVGATREGDGASGEEGEDAAEADGAASDDDDELKSLGDGEEEDDIENFIAEDGIEKDIYAEPLMQPEDEDDEEETKRVHNLIKEKFGDHWICGDVSQPAIEDDGDDTENKALAIRKAKKLRRQAAAEAQESQDGVSSTFFGRDEKSQSMWEMLADRSQPTWRAPEVKSQPALERFSGPPLLKRLASSKTSGVHDFFTPRVAPVPLPKRAASAAAALPTSSTAAGAAASTPTATDAIATAPAAGEPAADGPPPVRRFGSFADKGRYGSDRLKGWGSGSNVGSASKGFVFQTGSENSQGAQQNAEVRTDPGSRLGKSAASAVVKQGSARPTLSGGGAGAAVSRGPSLLTRVLGGSKNWKVPAGGAK